MIYSLNNDTLNKDSIKNLNSNDTKLFLCVITFQELNLVAEKIGINEKILNDCIIGRTSKIESYEEFEYISIKIPNLNDILKPAKKVSIIFKKNILTFVCEDGFIVNDIINTIIAGDIKCTSLSKMLYLFFDKLTVGDTYSIENIEQEIAELEEGLITEKKDNYLNKIIILRKKLLKLKRYYERLLNIAETIEENENELIDEKTIRYFRMFTNRINRLYQGIINLRDYVTQVREAYQSQVDIDQNKLMKLFTVVTTIFLPLTLIVGWYGMNFNMPEYTWNYGYPVVIILSISIIILCVAWFKKNKWF